jgi:hypothetical protein
MDERDVLLDIGFGDGRMLIAAALAGRAAVGVENCRRLVVRAQRAAQRCGLASQSLADRPPLAEQPLIGPGRGLAPQVAAKQAVSVIQAIIAEEKAAAAAAATAAPVAVTTVATACDPVTISDSFTTDTATSISPVTVASLPTAFTAPAAVAFATPVSAEEQPLPMGDPFLILDELDAASPLLGTTVLPHVTVVFLYLLPEVNRFLWPLLLTHLPVNARIVAYTFSLLPVPSDGDDTAFHWPIEQEIEGRTPHDKIRVHRVTRELKANHQQWMARQSGYSVAAGIAGIGLGI